MKNEVHDGGIHEDSGGCLEKWYYILSPNCGKKSKWIVIKTLKSC